MPIEQAFTQVGQLVRKFKALTPAARRAYNEDNTRKDFILPLFHALEWDTYSSTEVSAEERVSRGCLLTQQARNLPVPPGAGRSDFSCIAQVKALLQRAHDLVKFIPYAPRHSA